MALTSQQIADILFKKVATGKTDSGSLPFAFFEESINANKSIISKDYWVDSALIPDINPLASGTHGQSQGVLRVIKTLLLDWVPGTFAFTHAELKDIIPFNYGTNGSYNYQLFLNNGTTVIPMGTNDWYLDSEGGVLTFFNGGSPAFPTGVNSTSLRPRITCWSYIGAKNNPVLTLNESSAGAVADDYILSSDLRFYSPNIVYVIKVANTNTGISTININSLGTKTIKKNDDGNLIDLEADDINTSDWVLNSGVYEFDIINYTVLGFKEIGSVQLWTQISGNDFELVSADFEVNRSTKELRVKSLTNPLSQLRIMGGGKVSSIASSSGYLYLYELADVEITTLNIGDTIIFDGTNWVNGVIDLTSYALKPSSYTTNNLTIMDTAGEQLVDSGINISLFGNKYNKVAFVDSVNGNDSNGQKGSILKPYKSLNTAFNASSSGDLIFLMPGTHNGGSAFGLPLGNNIDYYFLNAEVTYTGYAALMGTISAVDNITCKIFGKGSFRRSNNSTPDSNPWAMITPYTAGLNLNIDGIDFYAGNFPFIGTVGELNNASTNGNGSYIYTKKINIKNSRIESYDNNVSTTVNAGNMSGNIQLTLDNCYFKGLIMSTTDNSKNYPYIIKATNTIFEAGTNSNSLNYNIAFLDYYDSSAEYKAIFERCTFKSAYGSLWIGNGFGGSGGTNKHLYIYDNKFTNDSRGWVVNETAGVDYKLINNWSENSNTGTYTVTNLISGSGFIIDNGLELF